VRIESIKSNYLQLHYSSYERLLAPYFLTSRAQVRQNPLRSSSRLHSYNDVKLSRVIGCLHDPANVQHYGCWKFAGRLLDRVNTPLDAAKRRTSTKHAPPPKKKEAEDRKEPASALIYSYWLNSLDYFGSRHSAAFLHLTLTVSHPWLSYVAPSCTTWSRAEYFLHFNDRKPNGTALNRAKQLIACKVQKIG